MLAAATVGAAAQAQNYTLTRGLPGIIFGYSSATPIIDDQSQVATVVWPNLSETTYMGEYTLMAIDGALIPDRVRSSPFRRHEADCFAVDLLPGRHTLSFSYSEYLPSGQGRRTYNVSTPYPVSFAVEVEAGMVYQLRALLSQGVFTEFSVDGELADPTIVARLAQSRTASRLAYTPLAGDPAAAQSAAARRTVQPAEPRRTVQPAEPRQATAQVAESTTAAVTLPVQSTSRRRTVQPAEPRRTVQPAEPRRTVQPAEPRRTVQPAAPRQSAAQVAAPAPAATPAAVAAPAGMADGTALLHIYRVGRMAGAAIGYDVRLGDEVVYRARNNSKITIPITGAGAAALWAKTESRADLPLDIEPGREYWIRCGMRMGAFVGRPDLEIVDDATGRAEFDKIPADREEATPAPVAIGAPVAPPVAEVAPEPVVPEPAPVETVEPAVPAAALPEPEPAQEVAPEPETEPLPEGIGNGTLVILSVAMPDSVVFRPAVGIRIPSRELNTTFVSGQEKFSPRYLQAEGIFGLSFDGGTIYREESIITAKLSDAPAGFRPERIVFTVSGREMVWDIASAAWVQPGAPSPSASTPPSPVESAVSPAAEKAGEQAAVPEGSASLEQGVVWSVGSVRTWESFDGRAPSEDQYQKWASDTRFSRTEHRYTPDQRVADGKFTEILIWFDGRGTERAKVDLIPAGGSALDVRLLYVKGGNAESATVKAFVIPGTGSASNSMMTETWEGNLNFGLEPEERTWILLLFDVPADVSAARLQLKSAEPLPVEIP
jgi:hypothetical protein